MGEPGGCGVGGTRWVWVRGNQVGVGWGNQVGVG